MITLYNSSIYSLYQFVYTRSLLESGAPVAIFSIGLFIPGHSLGVTAFLYIKEMRFSAETHFFIGLCNAHIVIILCDDLILSLDIYVFVFSCIV